MKLITVNLRKKSYPIIIGSKALSAINTKIRSMRLGKNAYIITNAYLKNKYGSLLRNELISCLNSVTFSLIPDSEKSKSLTIAYKLMRDIAYRYPKGDVFIVAFGGGVIGDLAGFVASIYKRGIPYIQIPTTLLAQVDSSIGGKTAVDLACGKNLVGAFYQPRLVASETFFLKTLSKRQIRSGLAEVLKYGIIHDAALFNFLEKEYNKVLALNPKALEYIVTRSSAIKARIVEQDEFEQLGIRTKLNFGHTIGHAIEAAGGFKRYTHGEAIALGMLIAADISCAYGLITQETAQRIERLMHRLELPTRLKNVAVSKIIAAHYHDKKFTGGKNRFVLLEKIGKTKTVTAVDLTVIRQAILKRTQPTSWSQS
ncbi:MAG: 3-dehydroquinate synthase [Candidatus Omnitrophica bacterium]|nr:3-dehydroquinate synthase [Candidatus Omnitrophota bacterium]